MVIYWFLSLRLQVDGNLSNNDTCFITSSDVGQRKYNCVISAKISELHLNYQKIAWFVWGSSNRESVTEISAQLLKYSCILCIYVCTDVHVYVCIYMYVFWVECVCLCPCWGARSRSRPPIGQVFWGLALLWRHTYS